MALVVDLLPLAVWITSSDGRTIEFSNAAARELPATFRRRTGELAARSEARAFVTERRQVLVRRDGERTTFVVASCALPSAGIMRRLYNLSAAESRVAVTLGRGRTPRQVAEELGTSLHTVRTHLKNLFAKTHTHSQNELVAQICGGVATLQNGDDTFP